MEPKVLSIAQIRTLLRTPAGCTRDAVGVDDSYQNNGFAQHVRRVDNGVKIRRVLAGLDVAAQIQERFVDLSDRAKHVLFEYHRKIFIGSFGFASVAPDVSQVFQTNACPQHGDDDQAQNRGAAMLRNQRRKFFNMQIHWRAARQAFLID